MPKLTEDDERKPTMTDWWVTNWLGFVLVVGMIALAIVEIASK